MIILTRSASDGKLFELAFLQYYFFEKVMIVAPFKMKGDLRLHKVSWEQHLNLRISLMLVYPRSSCQPIYFSNSWSLMLHGQ